MHLSSSEKDRLRTRYGPWALVTGATSGIGLELAERLAECGLDLIINARSRDRLEQVANRLRSQYNVQVVVIDADLGENADVEKLIDLSGSKEVGLLVLSAGFGTSGPFLNASLSAELDMLRVNCEAVLVLSHYFGQLFALQKRGGIVLMSSIVAFQGVPHAATYAATKAYIQTLGEAISRELLPQGVDVLVAVPGPVASGFGERAGMQMNMALKPAQVGADVLRALGRSQSVVPGLLSKVLVYSLRTVPRWGKIKIMSAIMKGFTSHQS